MYNLNVFDIIVYNCIGCYHYVNMYFFIMFKMKLKIYLFFHTKEFFRRFYTYAIITTVIKTFLEQDVSVGCLLNMNHGATTLLNALRKFVLESMPPAVRCHFYIYKIDWEAILIPQ